MPGQQEQTDRMRDELEAIANKHGSMLSPGDVVAFARDSQTALHHRFEWNDGEAAEKYRIWQARQLIAEVHISAPKMKGQNIRAFVSLSSDREKEGGYRSMAAVLSDEELRAMHVRDAIADAERFIESYAHLDELGPMFAAMRRAMKKIAPSQQALKAG